MRDDSDLSEETPAAATAEECAQAIQEEPAAESVDEEADGVDEDEDEGVGRMASMLESVVFAAGEPVPVRKLVEILKGPSAQEIRKALSSRGPGVFAIPGLIKIEKKKVPARPARKGVPNPFKPGELMDVAAKPASVKIKVRALKNLKDMV